MPNIAVWLIALICNVVAAQPQVHYRIGVLAHQGEPIAYQTWQPTADYLSAHIPEAQFTIIPVTYDNISSVVAQKKIDFLVTTAASYAALQVQHGISRIATLRKRHGNEVLTVYGAAIVTRGDRTDITSLADLSGKRFMALHENAMGGWWMAWRELKRAGIDPHEHFASLEFSGFPQRKVLAAVYSGQVDAGTVRAGVLANLIEQGVYQADDFKVLQPYTDRRYQFPHSTQLYPEWPFAILSHIDDELAQRVAIALLGMPENSPAAIAATSAGWTVPLDYQSVHNLMRELAVGPYSLQHEVQLSDFYEKYRGWVMPLLFVFALVLLMSIFILILNRKLSQSQRRLLSEMEERRLAEGRNEQLGRILDDSSNEIFVFDVESLNFILVNRGARKNLGYSMQDLRTMTPLDIKPDFTLRGFQSMLAPLREGGTERLVFETRHQRKDGSQYPTEVRLQLSHMGERDVYVAVVEDITERKRIQEALRQSHDELELRVKARTADLERAKREAEEANAAKSHFLSRISHELRTPLNAILGFTQLLFLDDENPLNEQQRDKIVEIERGGKHLLDLINEILDLSRIESGKYELKLTRVDLNAVINDCIALVMPLAQKNKITVINRLNEHLASCYVQADPLRLKQVLINLLSNAVKYNQVEGTVYIDAYTLENNKVRVEVVDSGRGIAPEQLEDVFQPFERLGVHAEIEGSGVGLSVTRALVRAMHGEIGAHSELGQGSTFWFELPMTSARPVERKAVVVEQREQKAAANEAERTMQVLYIEDNISNIRLIDTLLARRNNVQLWSAMTPEEGLNLAAEQHLDLILLDINLPGMDGYQVLKHLKENPLTCGIPVVAMSARAMREDVRQGVEAGFSDYITKPIDLDRFDRVMDNYLQVDQG